MSDAAWIAIFGNMATILAALAALYKVIQNGRKQKRMSRKLDGKLRKLLSTSVGKAHAEGKLEVIEHPPPGLAIVPNAPPAAPASSADPKG